MPDYLVAFWNVENLFAPEDHPQRPAWLQKRVGGDLEGWDEALFTRKIGQLAAIVARMGGGAGPDILGVAEVENRFVLDRLAAEVNGAVPGRSYGVVHSDSEAEKRGIDTAFLYDTARFSVDPATVFSHFVMRRTGTRDILQVTFRTIPGGRDLVAFCNHWPSRSGGTIESAGFRATAAETLSYFHERVREELGTDTPVIALGDFNDDPHDASLRYNARAWRERGDVARGRSAKFYNLAWRYLSQEATDSQGDPRVIDGTLYYHRDGNLFDQILVNRPLVDGSGPFDVLDETARIETHAPMVSPSVGEGPIRFGLPKGDASNVNQDGYSDHFPVSVIVRERP